MPSESSTESLLQRIAGGDSSCVRPCLDRYAPLVWSLVRSQLRDFSQAEDLVQEIFIEVWKSAERFDPGISSEANFIAVIARRRLIDRRRSMGRAPDSEPIEDHSFADVDRGLERVELDDEAGLAVAAVKRLRPEQRQVLLMSVVSGLSHSQIASDTGLPLGTVKSHVRRGLDRVREMLASSQRTSPEVRS